MTDIDRHRAMAAAMALLDDLANAAFASEETRAILLESARREFASLAEIFEPAEPAEEAEEDEPREYDSASYRADMIAAGRGRLLGGK
jgi:hypothetical protein